MYQFDKRIVMTLDAGGTNFVFSAMQANEEIVNPVQLPSNAHDLNRCLETIETGFVRIKALLPEPPVAISFAFPGPADYANGVIGDLPNLKAFRGGIALGPFLREKFEIPVFINNDGDLFTYGEAIGGLLPEINNRLAAVGSPKRYRNLLGFTLGTGFGAGIVTNGRLHLGDNGSGGDVWVFRHKKYRNCITEEGVGIAAIKRMYAEFSGDFNPELSPKDISCIADGSLPGNREAAQKAFAEFGEEAGDTIAHAVTLIDGLVVLGGGLTGAAQHFMPALMNELNGEIGKLNGEIFPRLQMKAYDLDQELVRFLNGGSGRIEIPGTGKLVNYNAAKRIGIGITRLGTSKAIALGAYSFALSSLDTQ